MASKQNKIQKIWKSYNLSIVLFTLFIISWLGQFFVELRQVYQDAEQHGKFFEWGNFWVKFWSSTLQNWQSEFLQLFTFVILTSFLIHKNSHESKDSQERLERKVDEILKKIVDKGR
jgi:ABC-type phosphate/phosphonate transport system permease subunit